MVLLNMRSRDRQPCEMVVNLKIDFKLKLTSSIFTRLMILQVLKHLGRGVIKAVVLKEVQPCEVEVLPNLEVKLKHLHKAVVNNLNSA